MKLEYFCIAIAAVAAALPLLRLLRRAWIIFVPSLLALVALGASWQATRTPSLPNEQFRPVEVSDRGYVSSKSCRACHAGEYNSWHASYHRRMTQVATAESVVGDFNDVRLEFEGRRYRLSRKGEQFFVGIQRLGNPGAFDDHAIVMTTGSHHMQFYWYSAGKDRELGKLPFVFLFSEWRWVPADATFLRPPEARGSEDVGQWNQNCINCHTTGPRPGITLNEAATQIVHTDTHVAEFGIACEACHGPGEQHVRKHSNVLERYQALLGFAEEPVIAHPNDIDAGRRSQICGQCHGISLPATNELLRTVFHDGFNYLPGDDLHGKQSNRILVQNNVKHPMVEDSLKQDPGYLRSYFWPDGMVRVSGREYNGLLESPCHTHQDGSRGVLQCMSCHQLHPSTEGEALREWADDQLAPTMDGDQACTQCHVNLGDEASIVAHTKHAFDSNGSRCYNCHMPHTTYGLLKGIRSHTVSSPSADESVFLGRPNACNLCHLDKTLQWTADQLSDQYGFESPTLMPDQRRVSAAVLWATQGDAGVRALVAWHMGWQPALEASGADWMPPYLGLLMADRYDAVRYVAYHALRKHAGFEGMRYDFVSPTDTSTALENVMAVWPNTLESRNPALLVKEDGDIDMAAMFRLMQRRDNRPVLLNE